MEYIKIINNYAIQKKLVRKTVQYTETYLFTNRLK